MTTSLSLNCWPPTYNAELIRVPHKLTVLNRAKQIWLLPQTMCMCWLSFVLSRTSNRHWNISGSQGDAQLLKTIETSCYMPFVLSFDLWQFWHNLEVFTLLIPLLLNGWWSFRSFLENVSSYNTSRVIIIKDARLYVHKLFIILCVCLYFYQVFIRTIS